MQTRWLRRLENKVFQDLPLNLLLQYASCSSYSPLVAFWAPLTLCLFLFLSISLSGSLGLYLALTFQPLLCFWKSPKALNKWKRAIRPSERADHLLSINIYFGGSWLYKKALPWLFSAQNQLKRHFWCLKEQKII